MNPHLKSDILDRSFCIGPTTSYAATIASAQPSRRRCKTPPLASSSSFGVLGDSYFFLRSLCLCGSSQLYFVFTQYSALSTQYFSLTPRSRVPAAMAQIAVAAAMTEPIASLGGSSRASRMAMALFQRLLGGFPFVIAAALLP